MIKASFSRALNITFCDARLHGALVGGAGNDSLDGGTGADQPQGGAGDDLYLNVAGEYILTDTEGHNTIQLAQANSVGVAD